MFICEIAYREVNTSFASIALMAGEQFIQVAMDNIRRAVSAKQAEVNDIRTQMMHEETKVHEHLNNLNTRIDNDNRFIGSANTDQARQAQLTREIMDIQSQKADIEHNWSKRKLEYEQKMRDTEGDWRSLEGMVGQLQQKR